MIAKRDLRFTIDARKAPRELRTCISGWCGSKFKVLHYCRESLPDQQGRMGAEGARRFGSMDVWMGSGVSGQTRDLTGSEQVQEQEEQAK
jgi:hypothetical protein